MLKRRLRLPDWHEGAPWYVLPFVWFGYLAMAAAFLLMFLTEWWILQIAVAAALTIMFVVIGEYGWAAFSAVGTVACVLGYVHALRRGEA